MTLFDQWGQRVTYQYNVAGDINFRGISEEQYQRLAEELGETRSALRSFFKILEQQQVLPEDLDHTLRQIAMSYKDLQAELQSFISDDPAIVALKQQARAALDVGNFDAVERYLNAASAKDLETAEYLQDTATKHLRSTAASKAENGALKATQLRYHEAADYYRQAVELLERLHAESEELLSHYLNAWGLVSHSAGDYQGAEPLHQRGLGPDHHYVAVSLNNLAGLYHAQGRYTEAEPFYQRALALVEQVLGPDHPHVAALAKITFTSVRS